MLWVRYTSRADETVNSAGKSATGATSAEEHDTSKDGKGVAREGSDMIKFNWMQQRRKTRNEGAIYILWLEGSLKWEKCLGIDLG